MYCGERWRPSPPSLLGLIYLQKGTFYAVFTQQHHSFLMFSSSKQIQHVSLMLIFGVFQQVNLNVKYWIFKPPNLDRSLGFHLLAGLDPTGQILRVHTRRDVSTSMIYVLVRKRLSATCACCKVLVSALSFGSQLSLSRCEERHISGCETFRASYISRSGL